MSRKTPYHNFFRTHSKTTQWFSFRENIDGGDNNHHLLEFDVHYHDNISEKHLQQLLELNSQQVVKLIRQVYPNSGPILNRQYRDDQFVIICKESPDSNWTILGPYAAIEEAEIQQKTLSHNCKSTIVSVALMAKYFAKEDFVDFLNGKTSSDIADLLTKMADTLTSITTQPTLYECSDRDAQIRLARELLKQFFE